MISLKHPMTALLLSLASFGCDPGTESALHRAKRLG